LLEERSIFDSQKIGVPFEFTVLIELVARDDGGIVDEKLHNG
jgi:hypothetical protein